MACAECAGRHRGHSVSDDPTEHAADCDIARELRTPREQRQFDRAQQQAEKRRQLEDNVLAGAKRLDPADDSLEARQLRETAGSVADHREMARRRARWR